MASSFNRLSKRLSRFLSREPMTDQGTQATLGLHLTWSAVKTASTSEQKSLAQEPLVGFNVPATRFLQLTLILRPVHPILDSCGGHPFINAALHTLESADIDMGIFFLDKPPQLIRVFLDAALDIHLAAVYILLFSADGIG